LYKRRKILGMCFMLLCTPHESCWCNAFTRFLLQIWW